MRIKTIELDGRQVAIGQLNFGQVVEAIEAEETASNDVGAMLTHKASMLAAALARTGAADLPDVHQFSVPAVNKAYLEVMKFAFEDMSEASGKPTSP